MPSDKSDKKAGRDPENTRVYSAPALEKGLDILEMLCQSDTSLSQKEISGRLGRSVSEIYRMLSCLVRRNYVVNYNDTYSITTKLFQLSQIHPPTRRLLSEAMPVMEELARIVEFSCHLTVYNRGNQTVVASVETPNGMGFSIRVGAEVSIPLSASGRVLLAFQDPDTMELRIQETLSGYSDEEVRTFRKSLHDVAVQGFASLQSRQVQGLHAISFPILDINRHAIAALSVPMLPRIDGVRQASRAEVEAALRECAARLTQKIG